MHLLLLLHEPSPLLFTHLLVLSEHDCLFASIRINVFFEFIIVFNFFIRTEFKLLGKVILTLSLGLLLPKLLSLSNLVVKALVYYVRAPDRVKFIVMALDNQITSDG